MDVFGHESSTAVGVCVVGCAAGAGGDEGGLWLAQSLGDEGSKGEEDRDGCESQGCGFEVDKGAPFKTSKDN